jgi:glycosyltransferase involved in cell wall biosynthesis
VADDAALAEFFSGLGVLAHANDTGETFGMVIAEAMAAGLPVVTHPCPGLRDNAQLELVEHGVTGLVAATPEAYAAALVRLLTDPALARRMGQAGRAKARALFDTRVVAARLMDIYDELPARAAGIPRRPQPFENRHAQPRRPSLRALHG